MSGDDSSIILPCIIFERANFYHWSTDFKHFSLKEDIIIRLDILLGTARFYLEIFSEIHYW